MKSHTRTMNEVETILKDKDFVILSAELSRLTKEENEQNTRLLKHYLEHSSQNFTFYEQTGVYNGIEEKSFLVVTKSNKDVNALNKLAKDFYQESILIADKHGDVYIQLLIHKAIKELHYIGTRSDIVYDDEAKERDNYSILRGIPYAF